MLQLLLLPAAQEAPELNRIARGDLCNSCSFEVIVHSNTDIYTAGLPPAAGSVAAFHTSAIRHLSSQLQ
jgi:hypothetical protein